MGDPSVTAMCEQVAAEVAAQGWSVREDFADLALCERLRDEALARWEDGAYHAARVGQDRQRVVEVRGDHILWLEPPDVTEAQRAFLDRLEVLRAEVKRATMLGLFDWEGHLALYPPGARYRRHSDVFQHARERKVTTVFYLNPAWEPAHGGALRLYLDGDKPEPFVDVPPRAGTLVTFVSEEFEHEVLPAHAPRWSLTGWFRVRAAQPW